MSRELAIKREHLFENEDKLRALGYSQVSIARVIRIRAILDEMASNPLTADKLLVDRLIAQFSIRKTVAYEDLALAKIMVGNMTKTVKSYQRLVFNQMIQESYEKAKAKEDVKAMVSAANTFGKYNHLDQKDVEEIPYSDIVPQVFFPTLDPSSLNIKPIANIDERIAKLKEKYSAEIDYVNFEDVGLSEELLDYAKANPKTKSS